MSRIWRWIAAAAMAGGLIAAGAAPAQAAGPGYGITISAMSLNYPGAVKGLVDNYPLVIYKDANSGLDTAIISGDITGAASGDVATLLAKPFGHKPFTATGDTITLRPSGSTPLAYTFNVTPTLATSYEVQVTGPAGKASSAPVTVYVTEWPGAAPWSTKCARADCTFSFEFYEELPPSAYKTEAMKPWYFYFDLDPKLSAKSFPEYLYLDKSATVSRVHKFSSDQFYVVVKWSYKTSLKKPARYGLALLCTQETESKDGLGLPGHHGCGAGRVRTTAPYIG